MGWLSTLERVGDAPYVLPRAKTMRGHADLFLSEALLGGLDEKVLHQVVNAASFPGVTRVVITPDCHPGYGVPIGPVIETEGILLPTAAGYDIGCGMIQLRTSL